MSQRRLLLVCTGNTCRSQMAAGLVQGLRAGWMVSSAGVEPGTEPAARGLQALQEIGIVTTGSTPTALTAYQGASFDLIVTFSERAQQAVEQLFPQAQRVHLAVDDPLTAPYSPDDPLQPYREARDAIRSALLPLLDSL